MKIQPMLKKFLFTLLIIVTIVSLYIGTRVNLDYRTEQKRHVAVCIQNQGMVTYEVFLFDDSTFYCKLLYETITGTYTLTQTQLRLHFDGWNPPPDDVFDFEETSCKECRLIAAPNNRFTKMFLYRGNGIGLKWSL